MNSTPDPPGEHTPPPACAATKLVVIDDEPNVVRATVRILVEAGYSVISGASAAEAIELTRRHVPAMLLLDVMLPDGNGMDVARQLKSDPALAGVFVILLSGFKTSGEDQAVGLATGLADGYISRPFSKPEFLARIDALLRLRTAQELLRESLQEKEALLKEVDHRMKNSLQLIISLLQLQVRKSREPETQAVLRETQARIRSVALLHQTLYQTGSYSRVNLANYLRKITLHLFQSQQAEPGAVRLEQELEPVEVVTRQAIPCGLIVNELMTNSLKHAFPEGARGEVRIGLQREAGGQLRLRVSDTGVGLPADFEAKRGKSLGLQLVSNLVKQLDGRLEVGPGPGAVFEVIFMPKHSKPNPSSPAP